MKNRKTESWFFFKFENADYKQYGFLRINKFIQELKDNIPVVGRFYYEETNEWQVKNEYSQVFNRLMQKHIYRDQLNLF